MDLSDRVTYPPQTKGGVDHNRDGHSQQIYQNSVGHEKWSSPEVIQKSTLVLRNDMNFGGATRSALESPQQRVMHCSRTSRAGLLQL